MRDAARMYLRDLELIFISILWPTIYREKLRRTFSPSHSHCHYTTLLSQQPYLAASFYGDCQNNNKKSEQNFRVHDRKKEKREENFFVLILGEKMQWMMIAGLLCTNVRRLNPTPKSLEFTGSNTRDAVRLFSLPWCQGDTHSPRLGFFLYPGGRNAAGGVIGDVGITSYKWKLLLLSFATALLVSKL